MSEGTPPPYPYPWIMADYRRVGEVPASLKERVESLETKSDLTFSTLNNLLEVGKIQADSIDTLTATIGLILDIIGRTADEKKDQIGG